MKRKVVHVNVLPGEPTDGTGIVCIHLFVSDERGPFIEPSVSCAVDTDKGRRLTAKPMRGRLACDTTRKRLVAPIIKKGVTIATPRTNDARAVTCLKCKATKEYEKMMAELNAIESGQKVDKDPVSKSQ